MKPNPIDEPAIIDAVDENTIYHCYPEPGTTSEHDAKWAIMRIRKSGTAYIYEWAYGTTERIFKASDRSSLNYSFLK